MNQSIFPPLIFPPLISPPVMDKKLCRWCSLTLVWQSNKEREKSQFKLFNIHLTIDLVPQPSRVDELA